MTTCRVLCLFMSFTVYTAMYSQPKMDLMLLRDNLTSVSDSLRVAAQLDLANHYVYTDLDSAEKYIELALHEDSIHQVLPEDGHRQYLVKAWVHQGKEEFPKSAAYYKKALDKVKMKPSDDEYTQLLLNYASLLMEFDHNKALQIIDQQLLPKTDTSRSDRDQSMWNYANQLKSRALAKKGDYHSAIHILLSLMNTSFFPNQEKQRFGVFNTLGLYLNELGDRHRSHQYIHKGLKETSVYPYEKKILYSSLITLFLDEQNIDSSKHYLDLYDQLAPHNPPQCAELEYYRAKASFLEQRVALAEQHLDKSIDCANKTQNPQHVVRQSLLKTRIYIDKNDTDSTKISLSAVSNIIEKDSLLQSPKNMAELYELNLMLHILESDPNQIHTVSQFKKTLEKKYQKLSKKQLKELSIAYETEKKELENQMLLEENKEEKAFFRNVLGVGGILVSSLVLILISLRIRNQNLKKEHDLMELSNKQLDNANQQLATKLKEYNQRKKSEKSSVDIEKGYRIVIPTKSEKKEILLDDIVYIKSDRNYIDIHVDQEDNPILYRATLSGFYDKWLPQDDFVRIHKSYIIHRKYISDLEDEQVVLHWNNQEVPIDIGKKFKNNLKAN